MKILLVINLMIPLLLSTQGEPLWKTSNTQTRIIDSRWEGISAQKQVFNKQTLDLIRGEIKTKGSSSFSILHPKGGLLEFVVQSPAGLVSSKVDATTVELSWAANSTIKNSFIIERQPGTNGNFEEMATTTVNNTSYGDQAPQDNEPYLYGVEVSDENGDPGYTNVSSLFTGDPFITTWAVEANEFILPIRDDTAFDDTYNFRYTLRELNEVGNITTTILEDEPYTTTTGEDLVISVPNPGTFQLEITGQFPHFRSTDALQDVKQWGAIAWQSMRESFLGWQGAGFSATDIPDLSRVENMFRMFADTVFFTSSFNADLSRWDVSNVTNMSGMFLHATSFNQSLASWDVSSVTDMAAMFAGATAFNQSLADWDVSSVTDMAAMFAGTTSFNQALNSWDVSSVTDMAGMFSSAVSFNQPLDRWDVSGVTDMAAMFASATSFNQSLADWDVSNVTDMTAMFIGATSFNQPLGRWDVSSVINMVSMFRRATSFNQPLDRWDVSSVTNMAGMFKGATSFNQVLNNWDVSSVTTMGNVFIGGMFENSTSFNQSLASWDVSSVTDMVNMFNNSGLSSEKYDQVLIGWADGNIQEDVELGASGITFCEGEAARDILLNKGWQIDDGGRFCSFITTWGVRTSDFILPLREYIYFPDKQERDEPFNDRYDFHYTLRELDTVGNPVADLLVDESHTTTTGEDLVIGNLTPGTYQLEITGRFPHFRSTNELLDIKRWGDIAWQSMVESFHRWPGAGFSATDVPDLSQVTDMEDVFHGAASFNQDLSSWDVSNVVTMGEMFRGATTFNQDLGSWNVSSVRNFKGMFRDARTFDQDLSRWHIPNVFFMGNMFRGATSFNQSLGNWNISNVLDMGNMFDGSGVSSANYDQTLVGWAATEVRENVSLGASGITFCEGGAARDILLSKGWQIDDGGRLCSFITTWKVETNEFTLPLRDDAAFDDTYNFQYTLRELNEAGNVMITILEDEPYTTTAGEDLVISNLSPGTYQLEIMGQFPHFRSTKELLDINRWGTIAWQSMQGSFNGWPGIRFSATDVPDLGNVTDMSTMFNFATSFNGDLSSWDVSNVTNMTGMFWAAFSFNQSLGNWNVDSVTNMNLMFRSATSFNQSLDSWEVSSVTDMSGMFRGAISFNQPLDRWDVSNVTMMSSLLGGMFEGATSFNQDLGNWDVSNVTAMDKMFNGSGLSSENYDRILVGWADGNVQENVELGAKGITFCQGESARDILLNKGWQIDDGGRLCDPFITQWNVAAGSLDITIPLDENLIYHFEYTWKDANENLVSTGTHTTADGSFITVLPAPGSYLLEITGEFPRFRGYPKAKLQDVLHWGDISWEVMRGAFRDWPGTGFSATDVPDLGKVVNMSRMFQNAVNFNGDLGDWDVSNVTNMEEMFEVETGESSSFNGYLGNWDVSNVKNMRQMFRFASSFDQDLSLWEVGNVTNMTGMFNGSGLSILNYDRLLISWSAQEVQRDVTLGAFGLFYCEGAQAINILTTDYNWDIQGGSLLCSTDVANVSFFDLAEPTGVATINETDQAAAASEQVLEFEEAANWRIYPNPARDIIHVSAQDEISVQLTDLGGQLLTEEYQGTAIEVPIGELRAGIYLLIIKNGQQVTMEKIIRTN